MDLKVPKEGRALSVKVRKQLAEHAARLRSQWQEEKDKAPLTWDFKKNEHVRIEPKWGFIKRTVDENFPSLTGLSREVFTSKTFNN